MITKHPHAYLFPQQSRFVFCPPGTAPAQAAPHDCAQACNPTSPFYRPVMHNMGSPHISSSVSYPKMGCCTVLGVHPPHNTATKWRLASPQDCTWTRPERAWIAYGDIRTLTSRIHLFHTFGQLPGMAPTALVPHTTPSALCNDTLCTPTNLWVQ